VYPREPALRQQRRCVERYGEISDRDPRNRLQIAGSRRTNGHAARMQIVRAATGIRFSDIVYRTWSGAVVIELSDLLQKDKDRWD
jgi:hypothetical protein